jgi:two-component system, NarL family, response regulator LiaR
MAIRDDREDLRTPTQRELEVLQLAADGMSNKQISGSLTISDQTVKNHLCSIFWRLGVRNRMEAIREGVKRGLIRFP